MLQGSGFGTWGLGLSGTEAAEQDFGAMAIAMPKHPKAGIMV